MAVTVSKAGPYYSSGAISFSSLRSNFRAQQRKQTSSTTETFNSDTGQISVSELKRIISTTNTDPVVPDSTENANISTSNNWKTSQFRNSVKYYYLTQSDTELNLDISNQSWNNNLNKNIRKFLFIDGICGSVNTSTPSAILNTIAHNLVIDVFGQIFGASGRGGGTGNGAPDPGGENGGNAFSLSPIGGNNVNVLLRPSAQVYGGGGGGERGSQGAPGGAGSCYNEYTTQGCGGAPGCGSGYNDAGTWGGNCCQSTCDWCWGCCERCVKNTQYRRCTQYSTITAGAGGYGGTGGYGRGYNNQDGTLLGSPGGLGSDPAGAGYSLSSIGYYWTENNDDAFLNVTGSGSARITMEIDTNDNPNTNGRCYDTIRVRDGNTAAYAEIFSWNFKNGIRRYTFNVSPKTYMVQISGNPRNVLIRDNGVKLRDNSGDDTNARIYITSVDQYTLSYSPSTCGATRGSNGESGGSGGDWATSGSGTTGATGAGNGGSAIVGSNYTISGSINASTIKGSYQPQ
jgi:hypothetical protein